MMLNSLLTGLRNRTAVQGEIRRSPSPTHRLATNPKAAHPQSHRPMPMGLVVTFSSAQTTRAASDFRRRNESNRFFGQYGIQLIGSYF
jgi:hypothetical protein